MTVFYYLPRRRPSPPPAPRLFDGYGGVPFASNSGPALSAPVLASAGQRILAVGDACRIRADRGPGKLPSFRGTAYTGAEMRPNGWFHPIVIDLDTVIVPSQHRPMLRQHDHGSVVGHSTSIDVDREGIHVRGVLSGEQHHVDSVLVPARNGFAWQLSVGADPGRTEYLEAGETAKVNGRKVTGPLTIARDTTLGEISFVALGADGETHVDVTARKGHAIQAGAGSLAAQMAAAEYNHVRRALGLGGCGIEARDRSDVFRTEPPYFGLSGGGLDRAGVLDLPDALKGVALRFSTLSLPGPVFDGAFRFANRNAVRCAVAPGALDEALEQLDNRDALLRLLIDHDSTRELCNSADAGLRLRLSRDGKRVLFRLDTDSDRGREAASFIVTSGLSGLSLNLLATETIEDPTLPDVLGILKAEIKDVSIVHTPRYPRCCLTT
jgi:HK97 family phage prohead protease